MALNDLIVKFLIAFNSIDSFWISKNLEGFETGILSCSMIRCNDLELTLF